MRTMTEKELEKIRRAERTEDFTDCHIHTAKYCKNAFKFIYLNYGEVLADDCEIVCTYGDGRVYLIDRDETGKIISAEEVEIAFVND